MSKAAKRLRELAMIWTDVEKARRVFDPANAALLNAVADAMERAHKGKCKFCDSSPVAGHMDYCILQKAEQIAEQSP